LGDGGEVRGECYADYSAAGAELDDVEVGFERRVCRIGSLGRSEGKERF